MYGTKTQRLRNGEVQVNLSFRPSSLWSSRAKPGCPHKIYTALQVIIRDAETGAVVYSAPYDATILVVVNLSSLPEGTYELSLYAFGKWWWGEFVINED